MLGLLDLCQAKCRPLTQTSAHLRRDFLGLLLETSLSRRAGENLPACPERQERAQVVVSKAEAQDGPS